MSKKKSDAKGVKVRIPADLAERLEALGPDWEDRVADILRAHLDGGKGGKFASFIADTVAPLKDHPLAPQVEKAAKDIASKVAKDVATAAAAAAFAAWTAKMAAKPDKPPADGDAPATTRRKPGSPGPAKT